MKINAEQIYREASKHLVFGFRKGQIYLKRDRYWELLSEDEAVLQICAIFDQRLMAEMSDMAVREALRRMRNTPEFQVEFVDEQMEAFINVRNGVFDAENGVLVERKEEWKFSYLLDFEYRAKSRIDDAPTFQSFLRSTFEDNQEAKSRALLEIIGYCLSDYTKAKTAFFLIGESNSGKSTVLELVKKMLPEKAVTAIPLQRLNNRFNLARLCGAKLNICTELSEHSFAAIDVFKQLTANEIVTAEHKGKHPFEFRIRCKSINAGNMLPKLEKLEGMEAVLNRMTILLFRQSISKSQQDKNLVEKMWTERNVICSLALDALVELRAKNFLFSEPEDSKKLKIQMRLQSNAFEDFLHDKCIKAKDSREHLIVLFDAFTRYCSDNLLDVKMTRTQFSQRFCQMSGVERKKMRVNGSKPLWGIEGIRLKNVFEEDKDQDSEVSDINGDCSCETNKENKNTRNSGTVERRME